MYNTALCELSFDPEKKLKQVDENLWFDIEKMHIVRGLKNRDTYINNYSYYPYSCTFWDSSIATFSTVRHSYIWTKYGVHSPICSTNCQLFLCSWYWKSPCNPPAISKTQGFFQIQSLRNRKFKNTTVGLFDPKGNTTRAETATILKRLIEAVK